MRENEAEPNAEDAGENTVLWQTLDYAVFNIVKEVHPEIQTLMAQGRELSIRLCLGPRTHLLRTPKLGRFGHNCGGASVQLRCCPPGEISLAHDGVLFLDELPGFADYARSAGARTHHLSSPPPQVSECTLALWTAYVLLATGLVFLSTTESSMDH